MMTNVGTIGIRTLKWIVCIPLMILIGIIQAVGIVLLECYHVFSRSMV